MENYREDIENFQSSRKSPENSTCKRRFLEFFESSHRSYMANLFCYAVRSGCITPTSIIDHVKQNANGRYAEVPEIIEQNLESATDFALYVLKWESLTFAEKRAVKEKKGAAYRNAYLSKQPPTEKQLRFLKSLGYKGPIESKLDAMRMIDQLLKRRDKDDK